MFIKLLKKATIVLLALNFIACSISRPRLGLGWDERKCQSVGGRFEVRLEAECGITIIHLMQVVDHQVIRTGLKSPE